MPPKSRTKQKKSGKKTVNNADVAIKLKQLLSAYECKCASDNLKVDHELKNELKHCIGENKYLTKFVLKANTNDPISSNVTPLIKSIRTCWYRHVKELYLWKLTLPYEQIVVLSDYLEQASYCVSYLELLECAIDAYTLQRFSRCFVSNKSVKTLVFDHTNLGEDGVTSLYKGLSHSTSLVKLSLCYCGLNESCGKVLSELISSNIPISELYLDGNALGCVGLIELLNPLVEQAELEAFEKEQSLVLPTAINVLNDEETLVVTLSEMDSSMGYENIAHQELKKNYDTKEKVSPTSGIHGKRAPRLSVFHAANNGVDHLAMEIESRLSDAVGMMKRWIVNSEALAEINMDNNLIGELGAREILGALEDRKKAGLKAIHLRITHRVDASLLKKIILLASGVKKSKKKKKKSAGKKRV